MRNLARLAEKVERSYDKITDFNNLSQRSRFYIALQEFRRREKNLGYHEGFRALSKKVLRLVEWAERGYQKSQWAA